MRPHTVAHHRSNSIIYELSNRFLVVVALTYMAGIMIGRSWLEQSPVAFWVAGILLFLIFFGIRYSVLNFYKAALILLVAAAGGAAFYYEIQQPSYSIAKYAGSPVYVEGIVMEEPLYFDDHDSYRLKVEVVETREGRFFVSGTLLVKIFGGGEENYWFGERLRLGGTIIEARGQRNPGGFDYRFYLRSRGVDALIYPSPARISSLGPGETGKLTESAVNLRSSMVEKISSTLPSPSAELLTAVLFGQRQRLPAEVEDSFRRAGVGHLMAVSGLHVGLVAGLILAFWNRLNFRGRLPLVIGIVLVFAYAYLTGMRPSALRAAVMVSMAMGALLLDRENDLPTSVAFAALATLFINPLLLFTVGFQLSYAATLALIYTYRPLERFLAAVRCPCFLRAPLAVTIAAQAGVLPLCVYYFQHLPTAALLFNLLLLPMIALVVGLGLAGALTGLVLPVVGEILLWASRPLLEMMLYITAFSSNAGFYVALNPPGLAFLFIYYSLLLAVLVLYYKWDKPDDGYEQGSFVKHLKSVLFKFISGRLFHPRLYIGVALLLAVLLIWTGIIFPHQEELVVSFIDVGQGAAALIEAPCGVVIMVDAGGSPVFQGNPGEVGERVVMPYLRYRGIDAVDLAVISHPHEDHFGGFIPMVGRIPMAKIFVSPIGGGSLYYEELLKSAENTGSEIIEISAGQSWSCGDGLLLEVIGPPENMLRGTSSDLNNNSIIINLQYGEMRILFTGDIEDAAVKDLLRRKVDIRADLMLVPHHGGYLEVMPAFLEAVRPSLAVIQVGSNPFGHPHPYVINALEQADVPIYRNDYHGAVIIKTDGCEVRVTTTEKQAVY